MAPYESDRPLALADEQRLAGLLGSLREEDRVLMDPPDGIWTGIAERLEDERVRSLVQPPVVIVDERPTAEHVAPVIHMTQRRRPILLAAAIATVIAGIAVVLSVQSGDPGEEIIASSQLRQLEELGDTTASAELVLRDGGRHLVISAQNMAPAPAGSEYELWLIDPEVSDPRPIGVVTGSGDLIVPDSIDPAAYPIVDISLEPIDGDESHSGHSLMRGELS